MGRDWSYGKCKARRAMAYRALPYHAVMGAS